jgi:ATP-dependent protease ClpP protease subunit
LTGGLIVNVIDVQGPIGGSDGIKLDEWAQSYRAAAHLASRVTLRVNCPGGDVMQGLAMFNLVRSVGVPADVEVMGIAASMGSYLAMVGRRITMAADALMFIHYPVSTGSGTASDLRAVADDLTKVGAALRTAYAARWKGSAAELDAALQAETLFTADECLDRGLCDHVRPAVNADPAEYLDRMPVRARLGVQALRRRADTPTGIWDVYWHGRCIAAMDPCWTGQLR